MIANVLSDIVICATSEEEDVCFVETKNLDGETNLKSRHAVPGLTFMDNIESASQAHLHLNMDAPEVNMYRLNGAAVLLGDSMRDPSNPENTHPISLDTSLLRGCVLRNTGWVIGIVAFSGDDTKIVQNSGGAPSKRSKVERQMNPQVIFNLFVLGLIAMVCAVVDHILEKRWVKRETYWTLWDDRPGDNPNVNGIITFLNALITFQNIIPISLYISIEFVRTVQALFIYWDHNMQYFKNGHKIRTTARSWNLSDDLGQIQYIFSDKTGTLTQNVMVFRQCSIGGKVYMGDPPSQQTDEANKESTLDGEMPVVDKVKSTDTPTDSTVDDDAASEKKKPKVRETPVFHDNELSHDMEDSDSEQANLINGFFTVLALCHTALATEDEDGNIEYKAQSPDEAALVQAAADVGYRFRGRDRNILRLETPFSDEIEEWELLNVLEFNSARKRMSVIVRKCDEKGQLFLLCKGADNIIFERLNKTDASQRELMDKTDKDLQMFASEGLRTLCLAYRILDYEEYDDWQRRYHEAEVSLEHREENIDAVSAEIESNLTLLGSTAIEDKLQDGVPECIADLKLAGIKVWVATGDKLETAVAIGYTTNLLTPETNLIIIREGNHTVYEQLRDSLEGFFGDDSLTRSLSLAQEETRRSDMRRSTQLARVNTGVRSLVGDDNGTRPGGFSLVIEGHALAECFQDPETNDLLLALSMKCNTVICCRVSPLQKAQIVRLIKDNLGVMTLAIGDGANDVSMIQAADVGVGISGEEGLQAVNSSDYATAQFRFLKRLLLVHGHWSYFRNSTMICNFFYKNVVGIGVLFWYMIYCGWSTTYVYAYVYLLFWNVFWTLCPVIAIGVFERDADEDSLMACPPLYRYGREGKYYNWPRFLYYLWEGVYQTAIIYFILCYTYHVTTTRGDGWEVYKDEMSTTMAIGAVMAANLFSGLNIDAWSWWVVFAVWVGPFLIWVFTAIYSIVPPTTYFSGVYGNDIFLFRSAACWFGWPFVLIMALMPRYLYKYWRQNFGTNDIDLMRLVRKYNPNVNVYTDPRLGGHFKREVSEVEAPLDRYPTDGFGHHYNDNFEMMAPYDEGNTSDSFQMDDMHRRPSTDSRHADHPTPQYTGAAAARPSFQSARPSFQSARSSGRGSAIDMSTGLSQQPSRGFGFTMEENGVAIRRMQSRLSQASVERGKHYTLRRLAAQNRRRAESNNTGEPGTSPFGKLRTRAGSILKGSRNRSSTLKSHNTATSSEMQGLSETLDEPRP